MDNQAKAARKFSTRQITTIGMLSAISIILGSTGLGFIPLPMVKATVMQIPVVIGAILEGPIAGAIIGLIFGLFSIFQNMVNPGVLSFALLNPLVSVLPRILIGIVAYYGSRLVSGRSKKPGIIGIGAGAALGSLTNTFGVLTAIYLLYAARYAETTHISVNTAAAVIYGIALTNGVPEAIIAVVVTIPVVLAVRKAFGR